MIKNKNYMELFDNGYLDAKTNKELLDKIFLETVGDIKMDGTVEDVEIVEKTDSSNYYKVTHEYDSDNDNNYNIDFYSKDNDFAFLLENDYR
jgi:hypothetical protein